MKLSKLAFAGAIAGLLTTGTAFAQSVYGQASTVQRTAFEYNDYYAQAEGASPSDQAAAPAPAAAPADAAGGCNTCANDCCNQNALFPPGSILNPCCPSGEPWKLVNNECLDCRGIKVAGWLAQSYTWNTSNPSDRFNGPVTWTDRSNDYQLNQLYWYAEKATDTKGSGWDLGGRIDFLYGTDNRFTTASGLETRAQFQSPKWSTQRFYGLAMPQAYFEVAVNDLKVKIGHFYAPVGYEVVPTTGNFFPSLPYTFQYGEPFTFTGFLATYKVNDKVSIGGGAMQGWDNFDSSTPNTGFCTTYTEGFSDGASLAIVQVFSSELTQNSTFRQRFLQTNVYSRPLKRISDRLNYVAQSDFGYQNDALLNGKDAYWYGLNQYLFYKVSDCLTYGVRYEWFRDEEGFRVGGFLGTTPDGSLRGLSTARTGYAGSFYEITFGANWKVTPNTTVRPYARFDWFSGGTDPATNPGNLRPFDNGTGNSQTLVGADLVTVF